MWIRPLCSRIISPFGDFQCSTTFGSGLRHWTMRDSFVYRTTLCSAGLRDRLSWWFAQATAAMEKQRVGDICTIRYNDSLIALLVWNVNWKVKNKLLRVSLQSHLHNKASCSEHFIYLTTLIIWLMELEEVGACFRNLCWIFTYFRWCIPLMLEIIFPLWFF